MEELKLIKQRLEEKKPVRPMTVRRFLGIFDCERRGIRVVKMLRQELRKHGLATVPDFENENIDNFIRFVEAPLLRKIPFVTKRPAVGRKLERKKNGGTGSVVEDDPTPEPRNPVVTIRQGIPTAGIKPPSVRPDEDTKKALSRLMDEKLELLVVQNGDRARVEGIFSYASFSHAYLAGKPTAKVGDCTSREFTEVNEEKPLIDTVRLITQHGTVVVRSSQNNLCGVVTARDVAPVFVGLAEPFLLLGQIENHLRCLLERAKLKKDEYKDLVIESDSGRKEKTTGPDDLTLGELIMALEKTAIWAKIGIQFDKATFTKRMHEVRLIRNKVMHFSPDGLPESDVATLKESRELLEKL